MVQLLAVTVVLAILKYNHLQGERRYAAQQGAGRNQIES
jgi:hypothetical protein